MKKSRFTETQMVKAINEHESGRKAEKICREMAITAATFYKWRQKYAGMRASEVKEDEGVPGGECKAKADVR